MRMGVRELLSAGRSPLFQRSGALSRKEQDISGTSCCATQGKGQYQHDIELSAPSPAPSLPSFCHASHHDDNGLNL
ncbi:hypothetical protein LEMLEM_LOCUS1157 [Lemmus lemmus]